MARTDNESAAQRPKKGDTVFFMRSWDGRGTYTVTECLVASCGPKRMTLTRKSDGEMLGRNFHSRLAEYTEQRWSWDERILLAAEHTEEAVLAWAEKSQAQRIADVESAIEGSNHHAYKVAMSKKLEEFHAIEIRRD